MIVIEILLGLLTLLALVPASVLFVQVAMALPRRQPGALPGGRRPALAIVVPAHNESRLIERSLGSIAPQLVAGDRLLVVADNCTDDTTARAAHAGAEVLERRDSSRRGKAYALDFALRHLQRDPPEVVLVVDADCEVERGAIDRLARLSLETARPVQALDLMRAPAGASGGVRLAEFAWRLANHVRPLGYQRLGLPCQLMGTGMAFPWALLSRAPLASDNITEDLRFGIDLARAGAAPLFCAEACVTSYFPASAEGIESQRRRWEHGHLGTILSEAPRLLVEAARRRNVELAAVALDLCVPPLALLAFVVLALAFTSYLFSSALPLTLALAALVLLAAAVLLAWMRYGAGISLAALAYAPLYALRKVPLYASFVMHRQVEWIRSRRDGE
jgi:cellulose synthase/poly-beta-1,6-N-acetylglucosamine synthase-like glycosyltransferase